MRKNLNKLLVAILILVFFRGSIIAIIITSYYPIQIEYNLSRSLLGLINSIYYLASFIGSLFWTYLCEKKPLRNIFLIGTGPYLFGLLVIFINFSYSSLLISVFILGLFAESITIVCFNIYIDIIHEKERGKLISIFFIFQGAGSIFGSFSAGTLQGIYNLPWNHIFGIIFIIQLILSGYFSLLLKNNLQKKKTSLSQNEEIIFIFLLSDIHNLKIEMKKILSNPINLSMFAFFLIFFPCQQISNTWLQKYWIEIHEINQSMASISYIFLAGAEFLGIIIGGLLIDRLKKNSLKSLFYIGIFASVFSTPLFIIGYIVSWTMSVEPTFGLNFIELCWYMFTNAINNPNIFISYLSLFFAFFTIQFITPLIPIILVNFNNKTNKQLVINMIIVLMNFGMFIAPILGGIIGDQFNLKILMIVSSMIYFLGAFFFLKMKKAANSLTLF